MLSSSELNSSDRGDQLYPPLPSALYFVSSFRFVAYQSSMLQHKFDGETGAKEGWSVQPIRDVESESVEWLRSVAVNVGMTDG